MGGSAPSYHMPARSISQAPTRKISACLLYTSKAEPIEVQEQPAAEINAITEPLQPIAVLNEPVEMTAEEYRAMIEMAKNAGPDDCEMCGS